MGNAAVTAPPPSNASVGAFVGAGGASAELPPSAETVAASKAAIAALASSQPSRDAPPLPSLVSDFDVFDTPPLSSLTFPSSHRPPLPPLQPPLSPVHPPFARPLSPSSPVLFSPSVASAAQPPLSSAAMAASAPSPSCPPLPLAGSLSPARPPSSLPPPSLPSPSSGSLVLPSAVLATFPAPPLLSLEALHAQSSASSAVPLSSSPTSQIARAASAGAEGKAGGGFLSRLFSSSRERAKKSPTSRGGGAEKEADGEEEHKQPSPPLSAASSAASPAPSALLPSAPPSLGHSASSPVLPSNSRGKKSSTVVPTNGGLVLGGGAPQALPPPSVALSSTPSASTSAPPASSMAASSGASAEMKSSPPPSLSPSSAGKGRPASPLPQSPTNGVGRSASTPGPPSQSSTASLLPPSSSASEPQSSSSPATGRLQPLLSAPPPLFSVQVESPSVRGSDSSASAPVALALPSPSLQGPAVLPSSNGGLRLPRGSPSSHHRTSIAQYIDAERRHAAEHQYHLHKKRQHQLHTAGAGSLQSLSVVYLPRGGIYVHTPAGPIQFGMPPETIKDSMRLGLTLPSYFIVPKERFNLVGGINVAEFEFPAYYNFFFKRRRINLITTTAVEPLIRTIFRETLLGPLAVEWPAEFGPNCPKRAYPDLLKEMSYFSKNPFDRSPLTVDSLLAFTHFDAAGRVQLDHGVCIADEGEEYVVTAQVHQEGKEEPVVKEIARLRQEVFSSPVMDELQPSAAAAAAPAPPTSQQPTEAATSPSKSPSPSPSVASPPLSPSSSSPSSSPASPSAEYFVPPHFGLTMLGNSDGFDSSGTTTGFVLWMNRRGIMVDPPPHSGALLKRHGISARLMRGVILTHCHADHDAGTFQKILEEGKGAAHPPPLSCTPTAARHRLMPSPLPLLSPLAPCVVSRTLCRVDERLDRSMRSVPCLTPRVLCGGGVWSGGVDDDGGDPGLVPAQVQRHQWPRGLLPPQALRLPPRAGGAAHGGVRGPCGVLLLPPLHPLCRLQCLLRRPLDGVQRGLVQRPRGHPAVVRGGLRQRGTQGCAHQLPLAPRPDPTRGRSAAHPHPTGHPRGPAR